MAKLIDTGRVVVPAVTGPTYAGRPQGGRLITGRLAEPRACTLVVSTNETTPGEGERFPAQLRKGFSPPTTPGAHPSDFGQTGGMVVRYGSGRAWREFVCDLKPGAYVLPPSEAVIVDVFAFNTTGDLRAVTITAALVSEAHPSPTRFTSSLKLRGVASGQGVVGLIPAAARWVAVWGGRGAADELASVEFIEGSTLAVSAGVRVRMDELGGVFVPPVQPVELSGVNNEFLLRNAGSHEAEFMGCTFYLEP